MRGRREAGVPLAREGGAGTDADAGRAGRRAGAARGRAGRWAARARRRSPTAHELLRELVGQDFDVDEDGVPRAAPGNARGAGHLDRRPRDAPRPQEQHQRFDGYKLSAAATNTAEPLITAVEVAPAGEQDGPQAKHLIDPQPAERRPRRVLGDTAYGRAMRAELADRGVEVLAPVPEGRSPRAAWPSATFDRPRPPGR